MSRNRPGTPLSRAGIAWWKAHMHVGTIAQRQTWQVEEDEKQARKILTAALDDPDMGPRISTWLRPCGHSRVLNPRESWRGEPTEYERGCSPCVRDRMRAYFLGESAIIDDIIDDGRNRP